MTILAKEPSLYPLDLLEAAPAIDADRGWWALHTRARQEKALARQLWRSEIPFYLPLVAKEHLIRRRRVRSFVPLFGGYVFLFGSEAERVHALTTNRVQSALPVRDGEQLRLDLGYVQRLIESDAPLTVERRLLPGQRVRIKAGSMMGLEGSVIAYRGKTRLLVSVRFLQQGVSVELDNFLLEPTG